MALLLATQCNCDKKDAASVNLSLLSVFDRLDWGDGVTYVIGHKTPDADAVCSAIAYAELMQTLGYNCEARTNGPINRETAFITSLWNIPVPEILSSVEPGTRLILTDHSDYIQSVDGASKADILQVIDHHGIGDITEGMPVYYRAMPVGSTCTIVFETFRELGVPVSEPTARVLLAGLISDTRNLKKNTTTLLDSLVWKSLSSQLKLSEADVKEINRQMVEASRDLSGMSDKDIFLSDYKSYSMGNILLGIGNLDSMTGVPAEEAADRMLAVMPEVLREKGLAMLFAKAELGKGTYIFYYGEGAREVAEKAFGPSLREGVIHSPEKLGRKTHVVPMLSDILGMAAE